MVLKAYQKINYRIIGIGLLALFFFFSCNKLSKKEIGLRIIAKVPYDNTPIPGVKYRIVEMQPGKKMFEEEETGWVLEGKTDANGRADVIFNPKKNDKYYHYIYFDYSEAELPLGNWTFINAPSYKTVQRDYFSANNITEIRALPKILVKRSFKNKNCVDENDKFKYRFVNADELKFVDFPSSAYPWKEGTHLNGCVDYEEEYLERLAGHYVFQWEAVRGGVLSTGIDTFFVAPGINNQINMHW